MKIICGIALCLVFAFQTLAAPRTVPAACQTQTNRFIQGVVTDKNNKFLSNLKIKAVNTTTKKQYKTVTGKSGAYKFDNLPLGTYTLIFEGNKEVKGKTVENVELGSNGGIGYNVSLDSK